MCHRPRPDPHPPPVTSPLSAARDDAHYFPFAFIINRELPRGMPRAWARVITALTVRPRSAAMSKAGTLEMMSFRSCSSSSEVQAFALFTFSSLCRGQRTPPTKWEKRNKRKTGVARQEQRQTRL